ncbi:hypothetical protein BV25DRAFT_1513279 [Artomyces pyxidatus]|uniref:Uncharacterized protein n=1 Tax=Artomyces pyxidatus TaxID=48021 RepID=A0ACB8TDC6_9AGAM|nr:hypothetical protein BV25DRAFT_1513279 [Artomyces pyxidatus]
MQLAFTVTELPSAGAPLIVLSVRCFQEICSFRQSWSRSVSAASALWTHGHALSFLSYFSRFSGTLACFRSWVSEGHSG